MRILTLYFKARGGGYVRRLGRLIRACAERGIEVHYLSPEPFPGVAGGGIRHHPVPAIGRGPFVRLGSFSLLALLRIASLAAGRRFDLLVAFGFFYGFLLLPFRLLGIPVVLFLRSDWLRELRLARRPPWVLRLARLVRRLAFDGARAVYANSAFFQEALRKEWGERAQRKVGLLLNNIDAVREPDARTARTFLREIGVVGEPFVVGYAGTFKEGKRVPLLVEAFAPLASPGRILLIAGRGREEARIRRTVERLGIGEYVRLLPWREDLSPLYQALDLFVLPTLFEGCPNALLEALSWSVPSIGTRVPGVTDVLREEELLFPPDDAEALREKLEKIIGDPAVYGRVADLSSRAAGRFLFDWDGEVVRILRSVAEGGEAS